MLWMLLPVGPNVSADRFHVELRTDGGVEIWSGRVTRQKPGELRLGIPRSRLSSGGYRLRVSGPDDAPVDEYPFTITAEQGPP